MLRRLASALGISVALTSACGDADFELPQRDEAIRAEEARVGPLIEQAERDGFSKTAGNCAVRVLGMQDGSTYVWADCSWNPGYAAGTSGPRRVDGTKVIAPGNGSLYGKSIRRDYPEDIADAIFDDPERLRARR